MKELMKQIGYQFRDESLLTVALTHKSYANEHRTLSYERLEFLGDSILSFAVSSYLYDELSDQPEGVLSKLRAATVCEASLAECARKIGIGPYLILNKGEEMTGGRQRASILADVFEAIVAAIYLDGGIERAKEFAITQLKDMVARAQDGKAAFRDYKTELQEMVQQDDYNAEYEHIEERDEPGNAKTFVCKVTYRGKTLGIGEGKSKKDAEQDAAMRAIRQMNHGKA